MNFREIMSDRLNTLLWVSGGGIVVLLLAWILVGAFSGGMMGGGILGVLGALSMLLFWVLAVALIATLVVLIVSQEPRR